MASFKLKFRPSTVQGKEGTLFFQVSHHRNTRTVYTDYRIMEHEWDNLTSTVRIAGSAERQAQLQLVAFKAGWSARQLAAIITEKEGSRTDYTTDDIVSAFRQLPPCHTLFSFISGMITKKTRMERLGTAKTYRDTLASFTRFRNGCDIAFDALDADTISQYEAWLKARGMKPNSSSCYLRTLRTLYLKAVDSGLTTDKDIFRHVFTGFARTTKRALPVESVRTILRLKLPGNSPMAFARDMFMLSFYLQGMSFVDMAYMKKADIHSGMLQYSRKKTGQSLSVCWEQPMQGIVDKYTHLTKGSPYLLPIITKPDGTERRQYERMCHKVNRNLKKVGEMAGLHIPLTTYVARHTWASTMRDMGYNLSIISKGLGHESLKTTQIYLSTIDTTAVAKANRKIMDAILK